jgi:hypothetical protein
MTPAERTFRALSGNGRSPWRFGPVGRVCTFALMGGMVAILIWMKLRVVAGVPRTAYADPNEHAATGAAVKTHQVAPQPIQAEPGEAIVPPAE